mmetsp:Transcript_37274/g.77354  ORF Transcript_37274/g.77354 Transcript_37274/m.77354 type:complete len:80 (+) Transcript_37274:132-371(+)
MVNRSPSTLELCMCLESRERLLCSYLGPSSSDELSTTKSLPRLPRGDTTRCTRLGAASPAKLPSLRRREGLEEEPPPLR